MNKKGFTLIELLVVITIIGILAAVAIPKLLSAIDQAKVSTIYSDISAMNSALQLYSFKENYPGGAATLADISTNISCLTRTWMGALPESPWQKGTTYAYQYCGTTADYTIYGYAPVDADEHTIFYSTIDEKFSKWGP